MTDFSLQLPVSSFQFTLRMRGDAAALSSTAIQEVHTASIWRGVIGKLLRQTACITDQPTCKGCGYLNECLYGYVYETKPAPDAHLFSQLNAIPHPYVVCVEPCTNSPKRLLLSMTLFGSLAIEQRGMLLTAIATAASHGIGKHRVRCDIEQLQFGIPTFTPQSLWSAGDSSSMLSTLPKIKTSEFNWVEHVPECPEHYHFELLSPTRLKHNGKRVYANALQFHHVFRSVLRRVSSLCAFYGEPLHLSDGDFYQLSNASNSVVRSDSHTLVEAKCSRFSASQQKRIPLDGIVGQASFHGTGLEPFWPFLWLGQWLHIGKATTMGLGRYRITR